MVVERVREKEVALTAAAAACIHFFPNVNSTICLGSLYFSQLFRFKFFDVDKHLLNNRMKAG